MLEATLAFSHLANLFLAQFALTGAVLLAGFAAAVFINLKRGRQISCGCFGVTSSDSVSGKAFTRLILLIGAEAAIACRSEIPQGSPNLRIIARFDSLVSFQLPAALFLLSLLAWLPALPELLVLFSPRQTTHQPVKGN